MATLILIGRDQMGDGDRDLGRRVLANFLRKSIALGDLDAIAFYNAGVLLAATDSPVAVELTQLHERGIDLLACQTCVEHYGLMDRLLFPPPSSMEDIVNLMKRATKVLTL